MLTPDNPQFAELVGEIADCGVLQALIVDKENRVVVGRHRLEAARANSLPTVPVIRIDLDNFDIASTIIQENFARQEMTSGKRAISVVALHQEFFAERKARGTSNLKKGQHSSVVRTCTTGTDAIPENPFCGDKSGLVHAEKWRAMPMTVKQMAQRYRVHPQDLAWAAHLWDAKDDPAAWKHIVGVWNGLESLGAAYAGFMGGKAPQKKHSSDSKMIGWIDGMRKNVTSMYKVQSESKETFEKHRDDLLAIYNDLRVLLEIPRERPGRHIKG
jgi:hypothetical protein